MHCLKVKIHFPLQNRMSRIKNELSQEKFMALIELSISLKFKCVIPPC